MENAGSKRQGPRPARVAARRRLPATRAALLETLQGQGEPTSLPALVAVTGRHANTVREHLERLRDDGLVRRTAAPASGRGRPHWLYEATSLNQEDPRPEYASLASALATVIERTSPDPAADARAAGAEWGRELAAAGEGPGGRGPRAARHAVNDIFDRMGFAPEPDRETRELRLTRCPLLEAAHRHPEVVCSVHLGIVEGVMESYQASTQGVELLPFVEPGACVLRLRATR